MAEDNEHHGRGSAPGLTAATSLVVGERQLISVLSTLTEGVALWDANGVLSYANPAMRALCNDRRFRHGETHFEDFIARLSNGEGRRLEFGATGLLDMVRSGQLAKPTVVQLDGAQGRHHWLSFNAAPLISSDPHGLDGFVSSVTDITELKLQSQMMAQLAHYDTLTGAPNRRLLQDRMRQLLPQERRRGRQLAVCYLDLDGFKAVNDQFGHDAGDDLLREAAQRLGDEIRTGDTVARLGGDEFVVLLCDLNDRSECVPVIERILRSLSRPYRLGGKEVGGVSASIGLTVYPVDDSDPDTLLRHADQAMYAAKRAGKRTYKWFNPGYEERLEAQRETLREMHQALKDGEFLLHYLPVVNCRTGMVIGAEALIRWQHPILGLLSPIQFLPLAEDNDLALEIGDFVLTEALRHGCVWHNAGHPLSISVNLFPRQLQRGGFATLLAEQVRQHGCDRGPGLSLEISEQAALDGYPDISQIMSTCQAQGVNFSLDDFGTGNSSLDQLRRVPAATLKIDRSLVRDIPQDPDARALVRAIIQLGRSFGRDVVAEGVEQAEQLRWLLAAGCDLMQGFAIAQPMAADRLPGWLKQFHPDPAWSDPPPMDEADADSPQTGF